MKRWILIVVALVILSGCATLPTYKISDNHYQNYRHGFVLDLPGGNWKVSKTVPEWFQQSLNNDPDLLLFNNSINGILAIICDKSIMEIFPNINDSRYKSAFRLSLRETYRKSITEKIKKIESDNKKNPQVISFVYEDLEPYSSHEMAWSSKTEIETELFKSENRTIIRIYPVGSDTVSVTMIIAYRIENREEAQKTWDALISSFKYGDDYSKVN